jgi:hypothetical protein
MNKNMLKHFLLALATILTISTQAQPDSIFIQKIDSLRKQQAYGQIIENIEVASASDTHKLWYSYQLACYHSLNKQFNQAFHLLNKAINQGAKGEDVLSDTDFELLYPHAQWSEFKDQLDSLFLSDYPGITHPQLALELWHSGIKDQQFRTLSKNFKKEFPPKGTKQYDSLQAKNTKAWHERTNRVLEIIKKHGWPGYTMVGADASEAAFLVMQHGGIKPMRKAYRRLKKAAKAGEASMKDYALMCDRNRVLARLDIFKRKQIYGTQVTGKPIIINGKPKVVNGKMQFKYRLAPLKKPEEVNKRREEVGLPPIQEYLKKWDIDFNVPQE